MALTTQALFSGPVCAGVATLAETASHDSLDAELHALGQVTKKRRAEFLAGRLALRRAQAQMGIPPFALLPGKDRAPVWPKGFCGSISHAGDQAVAVLGSMSDWRALGVDLEIDAPFPKDLLETVLTRKEQMRLSAFQVPPRAAQLIFSAKECVYKAQYPLTGLLFGFDMLDVTLYQDQGRFDAVFQQNAGPIAAGTSVIGHFSIIGGMIVCAAGFRR
ncbi:MAG: 4'-phosphopantetheinyl transferase family protein [Pararhodobacter sp.]